MKNISIVITLLFSTVFFAQIKGRVTDDKGNSIAFVNIFIENTYNSTTANENGNYVLNTNKTGDYIIIFQYLGYKTLKKNVQIKQFPLELNITMVDENFTLNEVVINKKDNLAIAIIKNAIENRKANCEKTNRYTADFYSRGLLKIKNLPKKIMGVKLDLDDETLSNLDSTGTGTVYLSETFSKLTYQKPNDLKEVITASKVAGNDRGFSYNTARNTFYDFYDNNVKFNLNFISPIASNAFNYYNFKLESSFFDANNQLINKVKIIPKRDKEPVFEGYIYIVDGSWALYAIDLCVKGYRMKAEFIESINLKQNFNYNTATAIWSKNAQSLSFDAGAFGIKYLGNFNYVFSNYDFNPNLDKKTFTNEIVSFDASANTKDNDFWEKNRPIPLTTEESDNYFIKNKLQLKRESKMYMDSIDDKKNKFSLSQIITGYKYRNSFRKQSLEYDGFLNLKSLNFNTVQGYDLKTNFTYKKWAQVEDEGKYFSIKTFFDYGLSDKKFRFYGVFNHRFNAINYADLTVSGGKKVNQFNNNNPITELINTIATLFFKDNYMKLYDLSFAEIKFSQDIANGVNFSSKLEYLNRKPIFNTTDYSFFNKNDIFLSNNPTNAADFINPGVDQHHISKISVNFKINFGNKFMSRPDEKINIRNAKFPTLYIGVEKAFAASQKFYEFAHLNSSLFYDLGLKNKGKVGMNIIVGKFFNAQNISFIDYKHFNGNQTHVGTTNRYFNVFNFMPYYSNSTNDSYAEFHSEYDDSGFIMNKLPLLNYLKSNLIVGFHNLAIPNRKPYSEITIGLDNLGFGKFKIFRIDYIRSYENGFRGNGVIFGCKILSLN